MAAAPARTSAVIATAKEFPQASVQCSFRMTLTDMLGKIFHALAWTYWRGVKLLFANRAARDADVGVRNRFEKDLGSHAGIMAGKRLAGYPIPALRRPRGGVLWPLQTEERC